MLDADRLRPDPFPDLLRPGEHHPLIGENRGAGVDDSGFVGLADVVAFRAADAVSHRPGAWDVDRDGLLAAHPAATGRAGLDAITAYTRSPAWSVIGASGRHRPGRCGP